MVFINGGFSGSLYPGTSTEKDTLKVAAPKTLKMRQDTECNITCDVTDRRLTLMSNQYFDNVQILIYGFPAGVKYSSEINLTDDETFSIPVDYPSGIYTIRLTLSDGTVLEGHFELE